MKFGGPVKISENHVIHNNPSIEGSKIIVPGVFYGGRLSQRDPSFLYLDLKGHAEWKPLQLDGEVRSGSWKILGQGSADSIFSEI